MSEQPKASSPPYGAYGSFSNLLNKLRETGIPSRIDPTVFGNASGSVSYSTIAALKYLNLIDSDGKPSQKFIDLVNASDEGRAPIIKELVKAGYPSLFGGTINLKTVSAGEFDDHIRSTFDVSGSTVDKVAAFFLAAAKQAGIQVSPHLLARKPVAPSQSSKKSAKQRKRDGDTPDPGVTPSPPTTPMSEKALEYRLVDLMGEAMSDPEVMQAIITVITFLKSREVGKKNGDPE